MVHYQSLSKNSILCRILVGQLEGKTLKIVKTAFRWRVDGGPILNADLEALCFFETLYFCDFKVGPYPMSPHPSGSAHEQHLGPLRSVFKLIFVPWGGVKWSNIFVSFLKLVMCISK